MPRTMRIVYKDQLEYDKFFTKETIGFRTKNIDTFKNIIKFVFSIIETVNFAFEPDGIKITSMDSSHISLIDCFIPKEVFSNYNCGSGNGFVKGINLKNFSMILNHLKNTDDFIMAFENNCDEVELRFISSKYHKFYTMKLLDIEQDQLDIPELENLTEISIDSKYLNNIINDFTDIGEVLRLKILKDKEKISLKCIGYMTSLKMILHDDEIQYKNLNDIELHFNIKNIQTFTKNCNLNKTINIKIGTDIPIQLTYNLLSNGYIKYYIAPRLEDSDI